MKRPVKSLLFAAIAASLAALLLLPDVTRQAAREGLALCARVLVPSLFPFFVVSRLIVQTGAARPLERLFAPVMKKVFGVTPRAASAFLLGLVGGYPTGAQITKELYEAKQIEKSEARRLVCFCNNAGPAFVFGVVGSGLFGSLKTGFFLAVTHALSAVFMGILLRKTGAKACNRDIRLHENASDAASAPFSSLFVSCVQEAGAAVLRVCMFVTLFSVVSGLVRYLTKDVLPPAVFALVSGMLELSGGVAALGSCQLPLRVSLTAASFLLAFSGLSVCAQTAAILTEDGLLPKGYLLVRLLQGLIAATLTYFASPLVALEANVALCGAFSPIPALPEALAAIWAVCGTVCLICRKMSYSQRRAYRV